MDFSSFLPFQLPISHLHGLCHLQDLAQQSEVQRLQLVHELIPGLIGQAHPLPLLRREEELSPVPVMDQVAQLDLIEALTVVAELVLKGQKRLAGPGVPLQQSEAQILH